MVKQSKAEAVASMLSNKGVTVSVAEGDTSGYFGQLLADTPGSSVFFYGGILAYAKYVQQHLLGISKELIDAEGSVSTMVSLAMAQRVRELCGSDIGISLTGIAGPTGTLEKLSSEDWEKTLKINVISHFYFTKLAIPMLKKNKSGSIVTIDVNTGEILILESSPDFDPIKIHLISC